MKHLIWTKCAIQAGGKLSIQQAVPGTGNGIIRARMDWPEDDSVVGNISMSIEGALELLEGKLAEDAAVEMQKSGAV